MCIVIEWPRARRGGCAGEALEHRRKVGDRGGIREGSVGCRGTRGRGSRAHIVRALSTRVAVEDTSREELKLKTRRAEPRLSGRGSGGCGGGEGGRDGGGGGGIDSNTEYMECIPQMKSGGRTAMGAKEGRMLVQ